MFDAITLSTGDIHVYFFKIRTVGDLGDLRDKYVEITTHLLLGDAGKLSFNFIMKNLGAKCNFANNWVYRPGEFQAKNESELKY
jgi:hypothetical protein